MKRPEFNAPAFTLNYFWRDLGPVPLTLDSLSLPPSPCEGIPFVVVVLVVVVLVVLVSLVLVSLVLVFVIMLIF